MTKAGIGFIVVGAFTYFLASQTQVGWLYLFDAVIWSLLVLSAVIPWYSLRSLKIERRIILPASAFRRSQLGGPIEDDAVEVKLKVTNNGRLPRYFIKVLENCPFDRPDDHQRAFLIDGLKPGSAAAFSCTAVCYRRGHYKSADATLQSSSPLGLVVRRRTVPLPLNLTVYPAYYQLEGLPAADMAWADWGHAVRSSAAAEFYGSREYRHGDPLKRIHWRNTARVGHFMLKEFEQSSQGSITVALETGRSFGEGRESTLEYSVKIAASLAKLCSDSGRGINIVGGEVPLVNAGWRESMDYLAHLEMGRVALSELTVLPEPGQVVVVVVPAVERELIPVLAHLSKGVRELLVVLLEGFTSGEAPVEFSLRLKGSNSEIISCSRGNLEGAIEKLGNSLLFTGKLATSVG